MTELIKSVSIAAMLGRRDALAEKVKSMRAEYMAIKDLLHGSGFCDASTLLFGKYTTDYGSLFYEANRSDPIELALKRLDASGWDYLMKESGMYTFMDSKARDEWREKISKLETPPFTESNIAATFSQLHEARGDIFERGLLNCLKSLCWDYKNNRPHKFAKKVIIRGTVDKGLWPVYSTCDRIDDLIRCFYVLDGKPEPDHRGGTYNVIHQMRKDHTSTATTPYYHLKVYSGAGTGHVTFLRPELVDKMNEIIAKHYPEALYYDPNP